MKYVLFYESSNDDVLSQAALHVAAHRARWQEFFSRGTLLMVGPFGKPEEGAMAIFTTREAAREFAQGDPFVINGVVANWYVRDWHEALT